MSPHAWSARWRRALSPVAAALAALAAGLAFVIGAAAPAAAHAELIATDPSEGAVLEEAPEAVTLRFNEAVRLTSQPIAIYDADGDPVTSTASATGPEVVVALTDAASLEDGTYVVSWNVLSGDGHPISGALTFSVGAPSASVVAPPEAETSSVVVTLARDVTSVLAVLGLLVCAGLALFVALVLPQAWSGSTARARLRRLTTYAGIAGIVGALGLVPIAAVYGQGLELSDVVSAFSLSLVTNELFSAACVAVGLGLILAVTTNRPLTNAPLADTPPAGARRWMLVGGAVLALAGPSLVGHTRAFAPVPLLIAADVVHLLAGAIWLGGLLGLVIALRALAGREVLAAQTLARFSTLAGGALLVVALTGTFLAWRILGAWTPLATSRYGWLLLAKIAIVLTVAGIGGWNRWRTLPAVKAAAGFGDRTRAAQALHRAIRVEAVALVVLLAVTGLLVNQSPRPAPVTPAAGVTGVGTSTAADLRVLAVLSPRRTGATTLLVQVQDASGEPYDAPSYPTAQMSTAGLDIGEVALSPIAAGTYRGAVVLPQPGVWEVQVSLPLSRFENPVTTVRLEVPR